MEIHLPGKSAFVHPKSTATAEVEVELNGRTDEGGKARRFTLAIIETSKYVAHVGIRADKSRAYVTSRPRADKASRIMISEAFGRVCIIYRPCT